MRALRRSGRTPYDCRVLVLRIARAIACGALASAMSVFTAAPVQAAPCAATTASRQGGPAHSPSPARSLTIGSLNIAGKHQIVEPLAAWVQKRGLDVVLLQEVGRASIDGERFASTLGGRLGFHAVYAEANVVAGGSQGLAIVSRYTLDGTRVLTLPYHRLRFRSRCRIALAAAIATDDGPLHVVNVHLDTRINSKDRIAQLAPVVDALRAVGNPQLIGGDFNTMNIKWLRSMWPFLFVERQAPAIAKWLGTEGFGTPFTDTPRTADFPLFPLRLDWVYLKHLTPLEWNVDPVAVTDHRGVWVRFAR